MKKLANTKIVKSFIGQFMGLRFKKQTDLIFELKKEKMITMDMLFVFYPIDLVFLNKNKIVIETKSNFRPFTFYTSKNMVNYIIELKKGSIKENKIKIGDKLSF